jgi:hypothetical protein
MLRLYTYLLLILVSKNLLSNTDITQFPSINEMTCGKCYTIVNNLQQKINEFKEEFDIINSIVLQLCFNLNNTFNLNCNLTSQEIKFLYDDFHKRLTPQKVCSNLNLCQ